MTAGRSVNSQRNDWGTPQKYVDAVKKVFGGKVDLDPCTNKWSLVDARVEYGLPQKDGLQESWDFPTVYVNPPYGSDRERGTTIKDWLWRCSSTYTHCESEVIALVPNATNTRHWKEHVWGHATAVCFLYDTRLRFLIRGKDEGKGAPMACAMIYWGRRFQKFFKVFIRFGAVLDLRSLQGVSIGERNA